MGKPDASQTDRIHSSARQASYQNSSKGNTILALPNEKPHNINETGGLNSRNDGRGSPSGSTARKQGNGRTGDHNSGAQAATEKTRTEDAVSQAIPPTEASQDKSEDAGPRDTAMTSADGTNGKPPIPTRMLNGSKRFVIHMKNALFHSWINVLLVFVPIGIIAEGVGLSPGIVFGMNAVAIIPLAGLLAHATESVAARLGDTLGALLNVSFGNAVELIIFIIALVKHEIQIVQASILGSILANLLLILGMAFLLGGLRYREQIYNSTVTQMSACLLSLSVTSLLLPTAFYASFTKASASLATQQVLKVSRGTSVVLLLVYILYLLFQLKSHAYMYESTPQAVIDEESHPGVLADIMNSSSSSDDSSSSDSTDSDSSGSGSIATAGKKIKRAFTHRRHRKSKASTSSTTSEQPSALSSPSATERQGSYWDPPVGSKEASRRGSLLGAIASGDEADTETRTRIRDFGEDVNAGKENSKSPERKKHRKKQHKKQHKKRKNQAEYRDATDDEDFAVTDERKVQAPAKEPPKAVGFADDVEVAENQQTGTTPAKPTLNMGPLSSLPRPALPKMFTQNVFVTPPPPPSPASRPVNLRSQSAGANLRRTSSLPDRLNQQISNAPSRGGPPAAVRSEPLPPFRHRAHQKLQKVISTDSEGSVEVEEKGPDMSRTAAIVLLLISTCLVAVCAEFMVSAIPAMIASGSGVSQAFIGLIILPIVGNAAEHVTAVTVAAKNKMDLAIGVALGSSIQIALFVTPVVVLLGWILKSDMSLYFNIFETISLFVTAFVVNFLVLDGRSNYMEGSLLVAAYVIIALGAFFYPDKDHQSTFGSVGGGG